LEKMQLLHLLASAHSRADHPRSAAKVDLAGLLLGNSSKTREIEFFPPVPRTRRQRLFRDATAVVIHGNSF
jgi:hypothetical protein